MRYLVPDAVARYIKMYGLYSNPPEDPAHVTEPAPDHRPPAGRPAGPRHRGAQSDRAPLDLARRIVELAEDKKAADIVLLDLGELTTVADAFVICSGGSERQISAIADGILDRSATRASSPSAARGRPRATGCWSTSAA